MGTCFFLLLVSSFPAFLSGYPSVKQCITCGSLDTPLSCTSMPLNSTTDTFSCSADISNCTVELCDAEPGEVSLCISVFNQVSNTGGASFFSSCFFHHPETEVCGESGSCVYRGDTNTSICCCHKDNCILNHLDLNVSRSVNTDHESKGDTTTGS